MFITTKVFDPELQGKAVKLSGGLTGNFIISRVHNSTLEVVGSGANSVAIIKTLEMNDFEYELIKMVILEEPQRYAHDPNAMEPPPELPDGVEIAEKHGKVFRSAQQIKIDNAHVEELLKNNYPTPMFISEIVLFMNNYHGHEHWNSNNASSFLKVAINAGKKIKRVDRGLYVYDKEAAE